MTKLKIINRLIVVLFVLGFASSCENLELDLLDNPNAITPENASLNDLYNSVQLGFRNAFLNAQGTPGAAARMFFNDNVITFDQATDDGTFVVKDSGALNIAISQGDMLGITGNVLAGAATGGSNEEVMCNVTFAKTYTVS